MSVSKDYMWNSTAGVINASEAVVMLMVTTRLGAIEDAGILTIAFAVGNLLMTVGKFGARVFHSTDVKRVFGYATYLCERWLSISAMALVMAVYVIVRKACGDWTVEKILSVVIISAVYMIESMEDCIWGELQRNGYLYIGGMMFSARWIVILVSFTVGMLVTRRLTLALGVSFVASLFVFTTSVIIVRYRSYIDHNLYAVGYQEDSKQVLGLFKQTLPFFISSFCVLYLNNAPKFSIDRVLSDAEQACFGFVAMPVFVIALMNQFIYQPYLVLLSEEWNEGEIASFRRRVGKQILILFGIGCACIICAAMLGVPVLSMIYSIDLSGYRREIVILQVAGLFLALSGFFTVLLTMMREGKKLLTGYLVTMVMSFLMMREVTELYGTLGASVGYMILMIVLCMIYIAMYTMIIKRRVFVDGHMVK